MQGSSDIADHRRVSPAGNAAADAFNPSHSMLDHAPTEPRTYLRRRGRMTAAQARALDRLATSYELEAPPGALTTPYWASVFGRQAPLALEIGFGNGTALAALAANRPDWNCVGIDVYKPGFGALMLACEREDLTNVRIVEGAALSLLQRLAPASVHQINVFFPDPWPKARHHKRRLVTPDFASAVTRGLEQGGAVRLATDWAPYAEHMVEVLSAEPGLVGGPTTRPPWRPVTAFEAKGVAQGRTVVELLYRKSDAP